MKNEITRRATIVLTALLAAALLLSAEPAAAKKSKKKSKGEQTGPIFYPPPPDDPRIQWLASYSSDRDVRGRRGRFQRLVLGGGEEVEPLVKPYGVAFHDGKIFTVDGKAKRVAIYDLAAKEVEYLGDRSAGRLGHPTKIAIDSDGTRYVADNGLNRIMVYDTENRYVRALGDPETLKPVDVLIEGDLVYVCDVEAGEVLVMDKVSGEVVRKLVDRESGDFGLLFPTNLAADSEGNIYVTDTGHFRVLKLSRSGKLLQEIGSVGKLPGTFTRPKGIALDREDRLYVVDAAFENVQIFDKEGRLLLFFGHAGSGPGTMNLPATVIVDYEHVGLFADQVAKGHELEYLILVASQYGRHKVNVFGFLKTDD